jgi:hypothetical protein
MFALHFVEDVPSDAGPAYKVVGDIEGAPVAAVVQYMLSYDAGGPVERPYIQSIDGLAPADLSDADSQAIIDAAETEEGLHQWRLDQEDAYLDGLNNAYARWCER